MSSELPYKIRELAKQKNAVILAHYYQRPEIQDVADYVGDSLGLSQCAAETDADMIVFAGVHFMAETAKILNPSKKVVLPDLDAGCSLASSCPPELFQAFLSHYPDHYVVTYINCSAEIKAMSDVVCTSSNAVKVVESIPEDRQIIFAPDKNLGAYVMAQTGRKLQLWEGVCIVHDAFSLEKLLKLRQKHPKAKIVAHPESEAAILKVAHYIGSTTGMIKYVEGKGAGEYIIATEVGLLHELHKAAPEATLIPAPVKDDKPCSECSYMKLNTLEKLYDCMVDEGPAIILDEKIRKKAFQPIKLMLDLTKN